MTPSEALDDPVEMHADRIADERPIARPMNVAQLRHEFVIPAKELVMKCRWWARTYSSFRDGPAGPDPEPMNTGHSQGAASRCP
jgi:hypothetical protein